MDWFQYIMGVLLVVYPPWLCAYVVLQNKEPKHTPLESFAYALSASFMTVTVCVGLRLLYKL